MPDTTEILNWLDRVEPQPTSPVFKDDPLTIEKAVAIYLGIGENVSPPSPHHESQLSPPTPRHTNESQNCDARGRDDSTLSLDEADRAYFAQADAGRGIPTALPEFADADTTDDGREQGKQIISSRPRHSLNRGHLTIRNEDRFYQPTDRAALTSGHVNVSSTGHHNKETVHEHIEESPVSPVAYQLTREHLTIRNKCSHQAPPTPYAQSLPAPRQHEGGSKNPFTMSEADYELRSRMNAEIVDAEDGPLKRSPGQSQLDRMRQLGIVALEDARPLRLKDSAEKRTVDHRSPRLHKRSQRWGRSKGEGEGEDEDEDEEHLSHSEPRFDRMRQLGLALPTTAFRSPLSELTRAQKTSQDTHPRHTKQKPYTPMLHRKATFDFSRTSRETDHEDTRTAHPPSIHGRFQFEKPRLRRACPDLPPGHLLHGNPFEPTPSEADTATTVRSPSILSHDDENDQVLALLSTPFSGNPTSHHHPPPLLNPFTAQIEGAYGLPGDPPIPIFPHRHNTTRCRAASCPVKGKHEKGPYLHEGKLRTREGNIFGASNPPAEVWDAYERVKRGGEGEGKGDWGLVEGFARWHFAGLEGL